LRSCVRSKDAKCMQFLIFMDKITYLKGDYVQFSSFRHDPISSFTWLQLALHNSTSVLRNITDSLIELFFHYICQHQSPKTNVIVHFIYLNFELFWWYWVWTWGLAPARQELYYHWSCAHSL
jgi:hypothetical protein